MNWPTTLLVTDQAIDISVLSNDQLSYYETLGERLLKRYQAGGAGRQLFTLSGPPGAGKSVVTALLEYFFNEQTKIRYINLGLDAFHFKNAELEALGLRKVKGRYDTYDTTLLLNKLQAFKQGGVVGFPAYSRQQHEPVNDNLMCEEENVLLLLEGQWILYDEPTWANVRALSRHNMFMTTSADTLRQNVIERHVRGGKSTEDATNYYRTSDLLNTDLVLNHSVTPDETILFYKDI